jgi:hypothetical protein
MYGQIIFCPIIYPNYILNYIDIEDGKIFQRMLENRSLFLVTWFTKKSIVCDSASEESEEEPSEDEAPKKKTKKEDKEKPKKKAKKEESEAGDPLFFVVKIKSFGR